ncbi:Sulfite exporter TauE/SafE [Actinokineospora alba]|uniref:Sulfite exporter TauE/SafE n=1 Tax=Actinokineospora alba TaxID=504798 RepID=A0A1H0HA84_9PSEU|nr:sulfite exporter TauE/SafE family protein [Actinokineospora alba]TDP64977.1 sulfite exporter TauE/SafE [Actinokineospora alba]SDH50901.1 Sulfite exporter TauE/SafE [Actinokineospora alba]SDO15801.1 Sulfite exporter TauE/SafE [Actinokineospora alba]
MDLLAVLLTGLLAGGISCAAVQGGLLAGLIARQRPDDAAPAGQTALARLGDDLAPVGGFMAGKLLSHTLLGALLGAIGGAVQLSLGARTTLQFVAGALIIVFGLSQLGVPGFRRIVVMPPLPWMRMVRNQSRSQAALAPAVLGFATVVIPCGVTLSVEALALASGSALAGAATMAVFVLGTGPLFAVLGYAARKAATAWRGRLAIATGVVLLLTGLYTVNGGLELAVSRLMSSEEPVDQTAATITDGAQVVEIVAVTGAYRPPNVGARAGVPTTLLVRSENAKGCVRALVVPSRGIEQTLPVSGETRIDLGVLEPGTLEYSCSMGMYTGVITVT